MSFNNAVGGIVGIAAMGITAGVALGFTKLILDETNAISKQTTKAGGKTYRPESPFQVPSTYKSPRKMRTPEGMTYKLHYHGMFNPYNASNKHPVSHRRSSRR